MCIIDRRFFITSSVTASGRAVSSPIIPLGALVKSTFFSSAVCGAWSVAIISIVSSIRPAIILSLSSADLRGGFIFANTPYSKTSSSVRVKWCGVASAKTFTPIDFAYLIKSTALPELICCMSMQAPVSRASIQSLATIISSDTLGAPLRPNLSAIGPAFIPWLSIRLLSSS